jgi:thiol-disulfide isomerase/thioredoxin
MVMTKTKDEEMQTIVEETKVPGTPPLTEGIEEIPIKQTYDETSEEELSSWYFFYSQGCAFCKQADPIIDELNKTGHDILKLDTAEKENFELKKELLEKYNKQCGTPFFINAETGNSVCGFTGKDNILKWLDGEDIPEPPRPKSQPPRPPYHGASKEEEEKWTKEYKKWSKENEHLPNLQSAEEILERPRPKTEPPKPPAPNLTDAEIDEWGKGYDKWAKENSHLPGLQPVESLLDRFKKNRDTQKQQVQQQVQQTGNDEVLGFTVRLDNLEQKIDKLMKHLGIN